MNALKGKNASISASRSLSSSPISRKEHPPGNPLNKGVPTHGGPGFKCKWILQATVGEERQTKVEPMIRIFHEIRAANPAERQYHAKDLSIRRHRTDAG